MDRAPWRICRVQCATYHVACSAHAHRKQAVCKWAALARISALCFGGFVCKSEELSGWGTLPHLHRDHAPLGLPCRLGLRTLGVCGSVPTQYDSVATTCRWPGKQAWGLRMWCCVVPTGVRRLRPRAPSGCGRPFVSSARESAACCAAVAVTAAARASRSLCRWLVLLLRRLLWLVCLLAVLWWWVHSFVCLPRCLCVRPVRACERAPAVRCTIGDATVPAGRRRARPHARQGDIRVHGNPAPLAAFPPNLLGTK